MIDAGIVQEGERVELIEGELLDLPVQGPLHATAIGLGRDILARAFGDGFCVRVQLPLALGDYSEPEPDLAVVLGSPRDYAAEHPASAALVVEIADTTLPYDCRQKASLYARSGIVEYWIVNLRERVLEVCRDPAPDAAAEFGHDYQSRTTVTAGGQVAPLAAPERPVPVADLLP
jgi:Uma2 family endonuclease